MQGGFDLMLEQLKAPTVSVMYYALAGVQNMAGDPECLQQVVDTESDLVLEALLEHPRDSIRRLATGALVNISELSAVREPGTPSDEGEEGEEAAATPPKVTPKPKEATSDLGKLSRYASLLETAKADRDAHDAAVAAQRMRCALLVQ